MDDRPIDKKHCDTAMAAHDLKFNDHHHRLLNVERHSSDHRTELYGNGHPGIKDQLYDLRERIVKMETAQKTFLKVGSVVIGIATVLSHLLGAFVAKLIAS